MELGHVFINLCVCYVIVGLSVPFFTLYELRVLKPILWEDAAQFLMSH